MFKNDEIVGKYFIIKDMEFSDYMKDKDGKISLYDTYDDAMITCGMYEFENVLVCKIEYNHIEPE